MTCCLKHGIDSADALLGVLGFARVQKNINDKDAFDRLVAALSMSIATEVSGIEEKAFTRLMGLADLDWAAMSPANLNDAIAAMTAVLPSPTVLVPKVTRVLGATLPSILARSREAVSIQVGMELADAVNDEVVKYLRTSESLFVTDYLKRRNAAVAAKIRSIVANALRGGATRAFIVSQIEAAVGPAAILGRSAGYWDVVAGQFANQARVYGSLVAMRDAGVLRYVWNSIMDEATSEYCSMMDGHVFEVSGALNIYDRLAASPEAAKQINPWVNRGRGPGGEDILYITDAFGHRKALAEILTPSTGEWDSPGEYRQLYTDSQLEAMGVTLPPAHANCRSVVLADV